MNRPDELWHMDMTKVWTAAHGWVYLHVIVDCCTRQVAGWTVDVRTRTAEAIGCVEAAALAHGIVAEQLTLGPDIGSQLTSRDFRKHLRLADEPQRPDPSTTTGSTSRCALSWLDLTVVICLTE